MAFARGVTGRADGSWLELGAWRRVLGRARRGWKRGYEIDDGLAVRGPEEWIGIHGMAAVLHKTAGSYGTRFVASAAVRESAKAAWNTTS